MNREQAEEIRQHFIRELDTNGFSFVVDQVNVSAIDLFEEYKGNPKRFLLFYLEESIAVLESISNKNFQRTLSRINDNLDGTSTVDSINVEQIDGEHFDLSQLPDYTSLVTSIQEIITQIEQNSNSDDNSRG